MKLLLILSILILCLCSSSKKTNDYVTGYIAGYPDGWKAHQQYVLDSLQRSEKLTKE